MALIGRISRWMTTTPDSPNFPVLLFLLSGGVAALVLLGGARKDLVRRPGWFLGAALLGAMTGGLMYILLRFLAR